MIFYDASREGRRRQGKPRPAHPAPAFLPEPKSLRPRPPPAPPRRPTGTPAVGRTLRDNVRDPTTRRARAEDRRGPDLSRLEKALGHQFRDRRHLERALTHSSYSHEESGDPDNEALEFLGAAA